MFDRKTRRLRTHAASRMMMMIIFIIIICFYCYYDYDSDYDRCCALLHVCYMKTLENAVCFVMMSFTPCNTNSSQLVQ